MKKFQVIFLEYDDDKVPYTKEYFDSKADAEKWADTHEFSYWDETWHSAKQDYVYQEIFRYHNPEDSQVYYGYEIKEINMNESINTKVSELRQIIKEEIYNTLYEANVNVNGIKFIVTHKTAAGSSLYFDFIPATTKDLDLIESADKQALFDLIIKKLRIKMPAIASTLALDPIRDESRIRASVDLYKLTELLAAAI